MAKIFPLNQKDLRSLLAASMVGVLALASACNDDNSPAPPAQPGQPGAVSSWSAVSGKRTSANAELSVATGGAYDVTDPGDGVAPSGNVTPDELAGLKTSADAATAQDLTGDPSCIQTFAPLPDYVNGTLKIKLADGTERTLIDTTTGNGVCYLGDQAKANNLAQAFSTLYAKYAVKPAGPICTQIFVYGVTAVITNSDSGAEITDATAILSEGDFTETLMKQNGNQYVGAGERAGDYKLVVTAPGYEAKTIDSIKVTADECRVTPQRVEVKLDPTS
jgi:hypothetical protein